MPQTPRPARCPPDAPFVRPARDTPTPVVTPESLDRHLDRFVPVTVADLLAGFEADAAWFGPFGSWAGRFEHALRRVIAQEAAALHDRLESLYAPFSPDRDTLPPRYPAGTAPDEHDFRREMDYLFYKANFERLSDAQVQAAISASNTHGLRVRVDTDRVRHLAVYARGLAFGQRRVRSLAAPLRGRSTPVPMYRRLGLVARLDEDRHVLLKLFRDIPGADLEALLPHGRVRMSPFDQVKVAFGSAGALGGVAGTVPKLVAGTVALSALSGLLLVAGAGLLTRTFLGYRRARLVRENQRTNNLYYHTLASNASVIHTLVRRTVEEEVKEALLAYALLASPHAPTDSDPAVDAAVQQWLGERFGVTVDFDCADALETLDRLRLWHDRNRRLVLGPELAIDRLCAHAENAATATYHLVHAARHSLRPSQPPAVPPPQ